MRLKKIISGGQIGVDEVGLSCGRALGLETGGTAPKGYRTHNGRNLLLKTLYGLKEDLHPTYPPRTLKNVKDSDGTVLFGDMGSPGCKLTLRYLDQVGRPFIDNPTTDQLLEWLDEHDIQTLNVAGNRFGPGQEACRACLMGLAGRLK